MTELYDYIVIGAGSAGCVLANRLSENRDNTVCLIESGGKDKTALIDTPMLLQFLIQNKRTNWSYYTEPQKELNNRKLSWPRGKVLGGSSSINAMLYIRGAMENYQEWQDEYGAQGWDSASALEAFKRIENNETHGDPYHGNGGPLNVKDVGPVNPLTERYSEACRRHQIPYNADFNGARQEGYGVYQATQKDGKRWSASAAFLHPVLARDNLSLEMNTTVMRVIIEKGAATGIEIEKNGEIKTLMARKEVILSGGAINSPQLLMLSGVGPADHLRDHSISVECDSPGVGQNLQDHLDIQIRAYTRSSTSLGFSLRKFVPNAIDVLQWALAGKGRFTVNPCQGCGFTKSSRADDLPDIQFHFMPGLAYPHGEKFAFGHGVTLHACHLYPKSRGHLFLNSADPKDPIRIQPNYMSEEYDVEVMTDCCQVVKDILSSDAFDGEFKSLDEPSYGLETRADMQTHVREAAETLYHPTSTCAMGTGPLSVLDSQCRVKGIENLRVIDASVMPRLIGGNTNAPTMMIATRAADMLLSA